MLMYVVGPGARCFDSPLPMPSASDFRRAFGLKLGAVLRPSACGKRRRGGAASAQHPATPFELVSVRVGHEALTPNERYAFPTELLLAPAAKAPRRGRSGGGDDASTADDARDAAAAALREALRDRHMVYSAYGSPYECAFELDSLRLHDEDASMRRRPAPGALRFVASPLTDRELAVIYEEFGSDERRATPLPQPAAGPAGPPPPA